MRTAYIQKEGNRIFSENCFSAALGFAQMGYKVVETDSSVYESLKQDKAAILVGGIHFMRNAMRSLGIRQPQIDNPHIHLPGYLGRDVCEATWSEIEQFTTFPFFIKPLEDHKLFTGYVVKSQHDLLHAKMRVKPDSKILLSEAVSFISEYRCFVLDGKLVGCKNYTGDFRVLPDFEIIESAITDYQGQPAGYSIDFGVTDDGRTLLIEMNDGFGLSAYGLNKIIYCKILQARWDQIRNS
jgi:hypothetical protein